LEGYCFKVSSNELQIVIQTINKFKILLIKSKSSFDILHLHLEGKHKMTERKTGLDAYEFGNLRHDYSKAFVNGDIYKTDGFLSTGERKLCRERGMIIPKPIKPQDLDYKYRMGSYDMDWWMCRIGATVDGDPAFGVWQREGTWDVPLRPAYVVDGTFDVFHGGHWILANTAVNLAKENGGLLYFLIQSNNYLADYKNKLPIYDELTRSAWFRKFGNHVDGVVVWNVGESWVTGYEILGQLMNPKNKENVFFVVPDADSHLPHDEGYMLWRRQCQIEKAGFSVAEVRSTYVKDVSSSKLRKKFNLSPTLEVLKKKK
jgi:glycerol-3-phosphate cytidylyltransferase-like family protein